MNTNYHVSHDKMSDEIEKKDKEIKLLKEQLQRYEVAADGANDGLWDWDLESNEPFISRPWLTMLGLSDNDNLDKGGLWESLLHPEDKEKALSSFEKFRIGKKQSYNEEFRLKHKDGSYRWILSKAQAERNAHGHAIRISGSHTDITETKRITDALKRSEERYRNLFQNSLVAMLSCQFKSGLIVHANEKFWELTEENDERAEKKFTHYFDSYIAREIFSLLESESSVDNLELQMRTANQQKLWVSFSAAYYPEDGICECILKDITQTKENLLELQKVNFELDSFVYHASHDLRSPLRSILGLIDLYRLETSIAIKNECIEKIEGSVNRLDDLVVELLSISRNDRVNDPYMEISLMQEINNSVSSYFNATNTSGLEIITQVKQTIPFKTDLTRVRIILNNLISNAIKYRSYNRGHAYINIEAAVEEDKAVIKVEDNGEGIAESKLPHIFDMFYRATEKSEGSGLGLYIVKKVADKLEAKIDVKSVELEGTTFTITIPNTKD